MNIIKIFGIIIVIFAIPSRADEIKVYPSSMKSHGIELHLSEPNPGLVQVVVTGVNPKVEAALMVYDSSNDKLIASVEVRNRNGKLIAMIAKKYLKSSHFLFPHLRQPEDDVTMIYFADPKS
jgi:hypothetical protein